MTHCVPESCKTRFEHLFCLKSLQGTLTSFHFLINLTLRERFRYYYIGKDVLGNIQLFTVKRISHEEKIKRKFNILTGKRASYRTTG